MQLLIQGGLHPHGLSEMVRAFYPTSHLAVNPKMEQDFTNTYAVTFQEGAIFTSYRQEGYLVASRILETGETDFKVLNNLAKLELYRLLESLQGPLPWGSMTGVRPINLLHKPLASGLSDQDLVRLLQEDYGVSREKAQLSVQIARIQAPVIQAASKDSFSLYINVPFCPTRCAYCSFPTLSVKKNDPRMRGYVDRVIWEMEALAPALEGRSLSTVYIGGGTPAALPLKDLEALIQAAQDIFGPHAQEVTVEVGRPDVMTSDLLVMLRDRGVDRISINPQSMNQKTLDLIGRSHTVEDIQSAFDLARQIGDFDINLDLILGLPGEGPEDLARTLEAVSQLDPDNLTVHTLALKKGSKFEQHARDQFDKEAGLMARMGDMAAAYAENHGYFPYYLYRQKMMLGSFENVGYCKPGTINRYNILMMEEAETILGVGMGASSKIRFPEENRHETVVNFKNMRDYMDRTQELVDKKMVLLNEQRGGQA